MIELYLNNRLCDLGRDFSVRLNRQLLNPNELKEKDAQYSHSITLPPTYNNHEILDFANVEEASGKFNREYNAELIINSVRVFKGRFRLSEVRVSGYKGNLYAPSLKNLGDIFRDKNLNELPEYLIGFKGFNEYINLYNTQAASAPQKAIFPYTLYGILPKTPEEDKYTPRTLWDSTVRMGIQDLPPSVNPMLLLKHIFNSHGYRLRGSAFDDERLTRLYMSYKNAPDYEQPWNFGRLGRIRLKGEWCNYINMQTNNSQLEGQVFKLSQGELGDLYACDLLNCNNVKITEEEDPGGNVLYSAVIDSNGRLCRRYQVMIPVSGYYKVQFSSHTKLINRQGIVHTVDPATGIRFVSARGPYSGYGHMRCATKLLRDRGEGDLDISSSKMDGALYLNNLPQNSTYNAENTPKYLPKYRGVNRGSVVFVDLAQNPKHVAGFQWGSINGDDVIPNPTDNPTYNDCTSKVTAAKPAMSWNSSTEGSTRNRLAIPNLGYNEYTSQGWDTSVSRYRCTMDNCAPPFSRRGWAGGESGDNRYVSEGGLNCVVWLDKGEIITIADVTDRHSTWVDGGAQGQTYVGWVFKKVVFDLTIVPFRSDPEWLKIDSLGEQIPGADIDCDDPTNFYVDNINLAGFLPADMKVTDFIENFCKAFNLRLQRIDSKTFELSVRESSAKSGVVDLDKITSVRDRTNTPLGLPTSYKLGFTIDTDEEGYVTTRDGGEGSLETGEMEGAVVEHKSSFSYNWFKTIKKQETVEWHVPLLPPIYLPKLIDIPLSVISKHEAWDSYAPYHEAMRKRYTNQPIRFWYADGLLNDLGATFEYNGEPLSIVKVSNKLPNKNELSYKNEKRTILTNFFPLLIKGGSHYTEVECYLTPLQYESLNSSNLAAFNGDLYYVAEILGYDPAGRNKTKIKLIRKT